MILSWTKKNLTSHLASRLWKEIALLASLCLLSYTACVTVRVVPERFGRNIYYARHKRMCEGW